MNRVKNDDAKYHWRRHPSDSGVRLYVDRESEVIVGEVAVRQLLYHAHICKFEDRGGFDYYGILQN